MKISNSDLKNLLLKNGVVKESALTNLETIAEQTHDTLDQVIIKHKLITEKDLTKQYAKSIDVTYTELADIKIPHDVLLKIPERIARKYQVVLFAHSQTGYKLAMSDPEDFQAIDFLEKQLGNNIEIYIAPTSEILAALDQYRSGLDSEINQAIKDSSDAAKKEQSDINQDEIAEDGPIAKTVNIVLEYAVKSRASDIHIEPRENIVQIRYRIDGVLRESMTLPRQIQMAVVSRIKILSNLKIDEHRIPQDGRFKVAVGSKTVAIRVSTLPVMDGEKVVMRILDESARAATLEELGFNGRGLDIIQKNLKKPHGMTLVTGPTGSGKSTTLYSILSLLNTPGVNISTVEDPVEYRIPGVNQTQVNPKAGMSFASGLRALLRQDPNIIMVGEIRDSETANLGVQAALTGHIVLSTLHTNNAATTLPRLLDMNIEPFLIASTVNTVIGQRLVRKLCAKCRKSYTPTAPELEEIKKSFNIESALNILKTEKVIRSVKVNMTKKEIGTTAAQDIAPTKNENPHDKKSIIERIDSDPNIINHKLDPDTVKKVDGKVDPDKLAETLSETTNAASEVNKKSSAGKIVLYQAVGCEECEQSGYQGRLGIYEILEVNDATRPLITNKGTSEDIQNAAVKDGMITMQQDGFIKSLRGYTTIEEVLRVTRE